MHSHVHDRLPRSPWAIGHPRLFLLFAFFVCLLLGTAEAFAHAVTEGDKGYIQEISGVNLLPFMYLGAKHMMTGYDHLLFLFGVIFFLYRLSHIGLYVSLFALGHSTTMILGVYFNVGINSYLIDAIIGPWPTPIRRRDPEMPNCGPGWQAHSCGRSISITRTPLRPRTAKTPPMAMVISAAISVPMASIGKAITTSARL